MMDKMKRVCRLILVLMWVAGGCVPVMDGVGDGPSGGGGGGNIPNSNGDNGNGDNGNNDNGNNDNGGGKVGAEGVFAINFSGQMEVISNVQFPAEMTVQTTADGMSIASFSILDEMGSPRVSELQGQIQIFSDAEGTTFFSTAVSDSGTVTATMATSTPGAGLPPNVFVGPDGLVFNPLERGVVYQIRVPSQVAFTIEGDTISGSLDLTLFSEDPIIVDINELTGTFSGSRIN